MERVKLNIQLIMAVVVFTVGIGLLVAGFILPPSGEIHNSVLVAFGEACTFCGALIGIDYRYRFKVYLDDEQRKRARRPEHHPSGSHHEQNSEYNEDN